MSVLILFLFSLISFGFTEETSKQELQRKDQDKVRIDLYYESLCPGCKYYYSNELEPTMELLNKHIELHTYPFGNAKHAEKECYGNTLHACAIEILQEPLEYVEFISCLMPLNSTDEAVDECGKHKHIDVESIKSCAKSEKGKDLLIMYGKATIQEGINYTPYLNINNVHIDSNDTRTLKEIVCEAFVNPPDVC